MTFKRSLLQIPVLGMLAFAAACGGGGDQGGDTSATQEPAASSEPAAPAAAAPAAQGPATEVKMVTTQNGASGVFEPANITVTRGSVVRWTNDGGAAHNVSFAAADNPGKNNLPGPGTYLTSAGQTYELTIDLEPGTYNYQCDPHVATGMKGTITVQ